MLRSHKRRQVNSTTVSFDDGKFNEDVENFTDFRSMTVKLETAAVNE